MSSTRIDWQAWWQLLRAANVFTAISNVIAGFLLVQRDWQPLGPLLLLILASICLYEAGMVLNDVFDAELDAVERPERPIPSDRIKKGSAFRVGLLFLFTGILAAFFASIISEQFGSIVCAVVLTMMILLYDSFAKPTLYGPLVMGSCRFFNVLLGASVAESLVDYSAPWLWALGLGIYTIGLTLIARREATESRTNELQLGRNIVLCGLIVALFLPSALEARLLTIFSWGAILLILIGFIGYLTFRLLREPSPAIVRHTVGTLITLFIPLDAAACALAAGWSAGFCVLLLLVPVLVLRRWTGQT